MINKPYAYVDNTNFAFTNWHKYNNRKVLGSVRSVQINNVWFVALTLENNNTEHTRQEALVMLKHNAPDTLKVYSREERLKAVRIRKYDKNGVLLIEYTGADTLTREQEDLDYHTTKQIKTDTFGL